MGLFDRLKKQEKPPEPEPQPSPAPETGFIDFHPYDTGLSESVRALETEYQRTAAL